jgi:hypothetical protein
MKVGILKCSGKEKIKFAETLQEGIITFNIYTHFNQLIFKKDELYTICGEIHPGWPSSSSLFIKKDSSYLFLGLTDGKLNKSINMPEDFPLTIELNKVLIERNMIDSPFKYYNVLYKYSSGNEVILLNQNESGTLRDYIIYQGIARMQELNQPDHVVCDGGVNGISFTIVKK